ncbi:hypothetical protein MCOR21_001340 [Pyricularia oryzae]|nr:hypothetical protein MCOR21_001340 [Pyricularia oryzae]
MQFATLAALFALSSSHAATAQFLGGLFPCGFSPCGIVVAGPGSNPPMSVRSADCSSFLLATVPSTTVTETLLTLTLTTVTVTSETPSPDERRLARRATITPSVLPTYGIICGAAAYRSACSCMGISASTTTSGSAVTTITSASTSTSVTTTTTTSVTATIVNTEVVDPIPTA